MVASLNPLVRLLILAGVTLEKLQTFQDRNAPANLPAGSPFWRDVDPKEQSNYLNSPRSQEYWTANHPGGFQAMHPNTWFNRPPGSPTHPSPLAADKSMDPDQRALMDAISIPNPAPHMTRRTPAAPRTDAISSSTPPTPM